MSNSKEEDFETFIKSDIIHKIKKVRGKQPPISENVEN